MNEPWWNHPERHCRHEPQLFQDGAAATADEAITHCVRDGGCPVLQPCFKDAFDTSERNLVRGGTSARSRAKVFKARSEVARGLEPRNGKGPDELIALLWFGVLERVGGKRKRCRKSQAKLER